MCAQVEFILKYISLSDFFPLISWTEGLTLWPARLWKVLQGSRRFCSIHILQNHTVLQFDKVHCCHPNAIFIFSVGAAFSCNLVCQQGQKRKMTTSNEAMIEENNFDANGNILQKTSSIQHFPIRTPWCQWKCHQKYLFYSADICAPAFTFHMGQWTASACEVLMALPPSGNSSIGYEGLFVKYLTQTT